MECLVLHPMSVEDRGIRRRVGLDDSSGYHAGLLSRAALLSFV